MSDYAKRVALSEEIARIMAKGGMSWSEASLIAIRETRLEEQKIVNAYRVQMEEFERQLVIDLADWYGLTADRIREIVEVADVNE